MIVGMTYFKDNAVWVGRYRPSDTFNEFTSDRDEIFINPIRDVFTWFAISFSASIE